MRWSSAAPWTGRAPKRVIESEVTVEPRFEARVLDRHLQIVPLAPVEHELFGPIAELHRSSDPVVEFPQCDVVFCVVIADGQPIAVRLHVEEDARASVRITRNRLEFEADCAVREAID